MEERDARKISAIVEQIKAAADCLTTLLLDHEKEIKAIGGKPIAEMGISEKVRVGQALVNLVMAEPSDTGHGAVAHFWNSRSQKWERSK